MADIRTNEIAQRMASDLAYYRSRLLIEVSGKVVRYSDVAAEWQDQDFKAMDQAWLRCVGLGDTDVKMRSLLERCRGASKTSDLAIMAAWGLKFAPRRVKFNWYSGDQDQAALGVEALETLCALNPWLGLEIQRKIVRNPATGSALEILSSDAATGYGQLVDAVLVDEIANWPDTPSAEKLWHVVASTLPKKKNCLCQIITNAGRIDSWQWKVREVIREDAGWYFHNLRVTPSWITQNQIMEQRRLLPRSVFDRTCCNNWTSGTDNGVDPADVEACCTLQGPMPRRLPEYDAYIAACDLGWTHDQTGLVVLAVSIARGEIALAYAVSWHPQDYGGELPLEIVEREIEIVHQFFSLDKLVFDPREATGLSQRLHSSGVPCYRATLAPAMQNEMAKLLLKTFNQRTARLYRHSDLIRDLLSLEVVDRTIGLKLVAARSSGGHSDLGFAYAIANVVAHETLAGYENECGDEVLFA